ncbi:MULTISPECIES: hypothetical protein [Streptosporangium]|uniref:Amidohydrolase n=1 Tax=Streptosporangium jomthongense TaxID=1193683 RepID=A0ABV8F4K4_9ACTN
MSAKRTVISGGLIISMDPELGDVTGGAVLIENDRIVQVARSADELAGVDAERIDATDDPARIRTASGGDPSPGGSSTPLAVR